MHTILLVQPTQSPASRTYSDYETVADALEGVIKIYEAHLKALYPAIPHINYQVGDLFGHMDAFQDISCLVQQASGTYMPHDRDWIKTRIFEMLKSQASGQ